MSPNTSLLSGVTVIDLTRVLAGPYCTMVLADLGARVIKVENPSGGDDSRQIGPFLGPAEKRKSAYFISLNRGKESIALNLKDTGHRRVFEALLDKADVLVENFRPGVMEKLGFGWETLHQCHPKLIYAAASGFGHWGPYKNRAAYDIVVQAMGGIMSVTGHPGGEPARVGTSIGDIAAGMFTAIGISAALYRRTLTGEGVKIDVAMLDSQLAILENAIVRYQALGEVPGPLGTRHPSITPFAVFQAKDGHLVIAAGNDALFQKLADIIELPGLKDDPRFATNDLRTRNLAALTEAMQVTLARRNVADWLAVLEKAGVPCGPLNNVAEALNDPHVRARNMVVTTKDPEVGELELAGNPIKIDGVPDPKTRPAAPDLDADCKRIMAELGIDSKGCAQGQNRMD